MNRGLYNNASAILNAMKHMDVKTHNIANVNTTAYKYDNYYTKVLEEVTLSKNNKEVGNLPTKIGTDSIENIQIQGSFINTDRKLDLAIQGPGFFKVEKENGKVSYTRDGAFNVDKDMFLLDSKGHYVLGKKGKIKLPNGDNIQIKENGLIFSDTKLVDSLELYDLKKPVKQGNNYYISDTTSISKSKIEQGYLEASNVNISKELADVIIIQHHLSTNQRALKTHDDLNKKIIEDLG